METPQGVLAEFLLCRQARDKAQADLDEAQAQLMKQMEADQRKSYRWKSDGVAHTVSYVQAHTTVIDEKGLRRALRAKVFDKYTKRVLDRPAMEKAMDAGLIDPVVVSAYVTRKPNKPHLSVTEKEVSDG
jgi:hypothetical protein